MSENNYSLNYILRVAIKKMPKVLIITLLFAGISFIVSEFVVTPKYTSSVSMIINNKDQDRRNELNISELDANKKLVTTYSDILKTRGVVNKVINTLDLNVDYKDLKDNMSVESENNNEIFTLKVEDRNPQRATDIANQTASIFTNAVREIMNLDNVQILDKAIVPEKKSSPSTILNTVLVGMMAFVISLFIYIAKELSDTSIKSVEDAKEYFDIPVLGQVPDKKKVD